MRLSTELRELLGENPQDRASWYDVDDPRPERGTMVPLYTRWMRFLQGDPCGYQSYSSTGNTNFVTLTNVPAGTRSAVAYVSGGDIIYRTDGSNPASAGDQTIQQGSTATLTGRPTIMGFIFAGRVGVATLFVTYYD